MAMVVIATLFPAPEHRDEVIAADETAADKVHAAEDGTLRYALHERPDGRLAMIKVRTPHPVSSAEQGALLIPRVRA